MCILESMKYGSHSLTWCLHLKVSSRSIVIINMKRKIIPTKKRIMGGKVIIFSLPIMFFLISIPVRDSKLSLPTHLLNYITSLFTLLYYDLNDDTSLHQFPPLICLCFPSNNLEVNSSDQLLFHASVLVP